EEDRVGRAFDCAGVGVVEHDVGALAAELERDLLQVPGRSLHDELADLGGARSEGVMRLHGPLSKALRAALTARLMSSASPSATLARVSPVAGFGVSNVLPDAASVHCPSMNSFRGAAVNSSTLLSTVTVMKYLISFILGSHNETTT